MIESGAGKWKSFGGGAESKFKRAFDQSPLTSQKSAAPAVQKQSSSASKSKISSVFGDSDDDEESGT